MLDMLFPRAWLTEKALDDAEGRSNMEVQTKVSMDATSVYFSPGLG
jgi:hypothetical protein